ncbi:hypothetical protein OEA41_000394 [Lepraria neglecta]|uniref:Uncharacterized protein n=1 Tax=Lepraria neglecta TaxID=209136 RepID=A0AAD9ZFN3_9LECA|nr:hypothetical protein OEA41_000394 [Lepraria neglecta]
MRRIDDPRIRQTLNQISQNLEAANQTTQASLFTFSQTYISPCLSSLNTCLEASCQPCFAAARGEHDRRGPHHRRQARGRESLAFDFYDDWEQDEVEWGNDELDRLLSGNDHGGQQPGKHGGMSYGSRGLVGRTKDRGEENDPNVVPQSTIFGFLERLPWKIGGRGRRYRPGVADLQENVGRGGVEAEPLIADGEDEGRGRHGRSRSGTVGSRDTTNSLSSRGDLFPSEDEDDAVPLDDEFAMVLERRTTGATSDDHSSKKKGKKRLSASRTSTKSTSTKETRSLKKRRRGTSTSSGKESGLAESAEEEMPSMVDLKQEEERVRREEEAQVEERRQAAHRLARERGLSSPAEAPEVRGFV